MEILHCLGTVVKIKEDPSEYTIIGYCPEDAEKKVHTYIGINAALGLSLHDNAIFFENEDIEKVIFLGYSEEKSETFRIRLGKIISKGNE